MAAANLKLPWWAEPFAVALGDLLLDIPFDILGIKLIWWTWHDTDPNIFDRTYSVPWTRYVCVCVCVRTVYCVPIKAGHPLQYSQVNVLQSLHICSMCLDLC